MHAPAETIAAWIIERGGASSHEVLVAFRLDRWTLRRRRAALARLGIRFIDRGAGSYYLPDATAALRGISVANAATEPHPDSIRTGEKEAERPREKRAERPATTSHDQPRAAARPSTTEHDRAHEASPPSAIPTSYRCDWPGCDEVEDTAVGLAKHYLEAHEVRWHGLR